jgi:hypothetical protein
MKRFQRGHWPWLHDFSGVREYSAKLFHSELSPYHILTLNKQKSWGILDIIFGFSGVIYPAETELDDFRSDYLGEDEAIWETALAHESGPYVGVIDEKNRRSKISYNCPFKTYFN